jgi:NAD+ synthase
MSTPTTTPAEARDRQRGFDVQANIDAASAFLRDYLASSGQQRYVTGLSGGIDSAVVAFLAARAVGVERMVLVRMPYGLAAESRHPSSTPTSLADAQQVIDALAGVPNVTVDIAPMVDAAAASLAAGARALSRWGLADRWPEIDAPVNAPVLGNLKARSRAVVLRGIANQYEGLVLGTENFTEHMVGYFTIGGDEESDIEVLSPFVKREVRGLARALGVPQAILDKAPSADLWTGHTDEGELGVTYEEMDLVISAGQRFEDITGPAAYRDLPATTGLPADVVHRVLDRIAATRFKRAAKPTFGGVFDSGG